MSALAGYAVVERVHGEIDERVGQAPRVVATVVLAIALGQRLQRAAQGTGSDLVEDSLDQDDSIIGGAEGEASRLHSLILLIDDALGIGGMLGMRAGVLELDQAFLARVVQEPGLVELLAAGDCRPRNQGE